MPLSDESESKFRCPDDTTGNPIDGAYRDPKDPLTYFHCIEGVPYASHCPYGTTFNPVFIMDNCSVEYIICKTDTSVKQQNNKTLIKETKDFTECPTDAAGDFYDVTVPHPEMCGLYYHCKDGIAWRNSCPKDYRFNPQISVQGLKLCVHMDHGHCPINGGWSNWGQWSDCPRECGGTNNIRRRTRSCNNPPPSYGGRPCEGSSTDTLICSNCPKDAVAMYLVRTTNATGASQDLSFDRVLVDVHNNYNPATYQFRTPESGMYFMSVSTGLHPMRSAQIDIVKTGSPVPIGAVTRRHQLHNGIDTMATHSLFKLGKDEMVHLISTSIASGPPNSSLISWTLFDVIDLNKPIVAFKARLEAPGNQGPLYSGTVPFSHVDFHPLTVHGFRTGVESHFTAPVQGIYVFSMALATSSKTSGWTLMMSGGKHQGMERYGTTAEMTVISRMGMASLKSGDTARVNNNLNIDYSSQFQMTSHSGFLYSPIKFLPVAFYADKDGTYGHHALDNDLNPVPFDKIGVNVGNAFSNNTFVCKVPGYYFISFGTGIQSQRRVDMWLQKNNINEAGIYRDIGYDSFDTLTRSLIVGLKKDDTLHVLARKGSGVYSYDRMHHLYFLGFLLQKFEN